MVALWEFYIRQGHGQFFCEVTWCLTEKA